MRCFLSYAREDARWAQQIAVRLRADGHDCFEDRTSLTPGDAVDSEIRRQLRRAHLFLFLITPRSIAPGRYTLTEVEIARRRWPRPAGRVMPVMVEETPVSAIPAYLAAAQVLRARGDLVAEVAIAVEAFSRTRRLRAAAGTALVSVACGLVAIAIRTVPSPPHQEHAVATIAAAAPPPVPAPPPPPPLPANRPATDPAPLVAPPIAPARVPGASRRPYRPAISADSHRDDSATLPAPPRPPGPPPPAPSPSAPAFSFFDPPLLMIPDLADAFLAADASASAGHWLRAETELSAVAIGHDDPRLYLALAEIYIAWAPPSHCEQAELEISRAERRALPDDLRRLAQALRQRAEALLARAAR